jgi:succinate dehydrogenase / fumarate reductase, iron-sulfur subunit
MPTPAQTARRPDPAPRLPVSEFLADRAGAASPFGDDLTFPLPAAALTYRHPR